MIAGNFNLTNVDELFNKLIDLGQYPVETSDTITILEKIGHFLDEENEELYKKFKEEGYPKREITYQIAKASSVKLVIYDILGREIKSLVNELKQAGRYMVEFNGTQFASGVYFYRIQSGDFTQVKKMVLIK